MGRRPSKHAAPEWSLNLSEAEKSKIHDAIQKGLDSLRDGKGVDGEPVFDEIEAELLRLERTTKI